MQLLDKIIYKEGIIHYTWRDSDVGQFSPP